MSFGNQGKLFFVFFHKDEFKNSNIDVFLILHDSRVLSNPFSKKKLEIETNFKFKYEKMQYRKFKCFCFLCCRIFLLNIVIDYCLLC